MPQPRAVLVASFAAVAATLSMLQPAPAQAGTRAYSAGHFALALDGAGPFYTRKISGGELRAEVETTEVGGTLAKEVVGFAYGDVDVEVDLAAMPRQLADWINESFEGAHTRQSGVWVEPDAAGEGMTAREFIDARIIEVAFPKLDAASKDPAPLRVSLSPDVVQSAPPPRLVLAEDGETRKKWTPAGFKLEIGDLPCSLVQTIDELVIKQAVKGDTGPIEVPNLRFTMSAADSGPWLDWFEDFVIAGQSGDADELSGSITFLQADQKSPLGSLELGGLGIVSIEPGKQDAGSESVESVTVELYVETLRFEPSEDE